MYDPRKSPIFAKKNQMDVPFVYGKIVAAEDFTDRKNETAKLLANIGSLTNTAIISPRRWGKSSLVSKVIEIAESSGKDYLFVRMNVFKCGDEQEFYQTYAKSIMSQISSTLENMMSNAKEFISSLLPKVALSDPTGQYELSFGLDVKSNPIGEDILDLPQRIATKKGKKIIACIDEFQQIGEFAGSARFQKILRNHWQEQSDVAYVLYGSKKHMMLNIFGEYNSPFYRFGDILFLPKISNKDWCDYIVGRFSNTGKSISPDVASYLAERVDNHSYYVQQLAQACWLRSTVSCSESVVDSALESIMDSLNLQFLNTMDSLTEKQRNYLCAVADGVEHFSSTETLSRYKLGTNGNVRIMRDALRKRDIIDVEGKRVFIQDPMFLLWLKTQYRTF